MHVQALNSSLYVHSNISLILSSAYLSNKCLIISAGMVLPDATPPPSTHTTASLMEPSLNLRNPALAPQNSRNSVACDIVNKYFRVVYATSSLSEGGPTSRVENACSVSNSNAMVTSSLGGGGESDNDHCVCVRGVKINIII